MVLQGELVLTLGLLGTVTDPYLGNVLEQPLPMMRHIHAQLQACVPALPTAGSQSHSPCPSHWLRRLNQASKKEPHGCLQASVTLNLFCLLIRDLRCVARPDLCA